MDPLRIATQALFAYLVLLVLLRLAGRPMMREGGSIDFVLALVIGDLVDDAIWGEVPFVQFVVASTTLLASKYLLTVQKQPKQSARAING